MHLNISGKRALVTGASRGIGEAICKTLAREGAEIMACSRNINDLELLLKELVGNDHKIFQVDFSDNSSLLNLIDTLIERNLFPDIIVNNVGGNLNFTNPLGPISEWRQVFHLNLDVAFQINAAFIPFMIDKNWGRICHISSISALENQGPPAYCAAKSALNAYVRSLGRYVSQHNVILTSVMPGAIFTKGGYWDEAMQNRPDHVSKYLNDRMAIKRFGEVSEISEAVVFLCSELASFCVGSCLLIDGGQGRTFHLQE